MSEEKLHELYNFLLKDLLNGIDGQDILQQSKDGRLFIGTRELNQSQTVEVIEGAKFLNASPTLRLLLNNLKIAANDRVFNSSRDANDILFGKAALWIVDILEKKIQNLSSIEVKVAKKLKKPDES